MEIVITEVPNENCNFNKGSPRISEGSHERGMSFSQSTEDMRIAADRYLPPKEQDMGNDLPLGQPSPQRCH